MTRSSTEPDIIAGRKYYRSFYVADEVFARFRAAVYWSARRDEDDVPENMSTAVESWMVELADELERRFNDGRPFRPAPQKPRKPRKSRTSG